MNFVFRDVLYELASVGDLPLPQPSPAPSNKRERDSDTTLSAGSSPAAGSSTLSPSPQLSVPGGPRNIAGSKRVAREQFAQRQQHLQQQSGRTASQTYLSPNPDTPSISSSSPEVSGGGTYGLPMYTEELGRVPLHSFCDIHNWQSDPMTVPTTAQGGPATATAAAATIGGMDPTIASMFAMPPTLYDHPMASGSGGGGCGSGGGGGGGAGPSSQTEFVGFMTGMAGLGGGGGGGGGVMGGPGISGVGGLGSARTPFTDSDTLAMWSNAPAGFECVSFFS